MYICIYMYVFIYICMYIYTLLHVPRSHIYVRVCVREGVCNMTHSYVVRPMHTCPDCAHVT